MHVSELFVLNHLEIVSFWFLPCICPIVRSLSSLSTPAQWIKSGVKLCSWLQNILGQHLNHLHSFKQVGRERKLPIWHLFGVLNNNNAGSVQEP